MNEILNMLNALTADELDSVIVRANIMLEKKRKEEAEAAQRERERLRMEKLEQERRRLEEIAELQRKLRELQSQSAAVLEEPVPAAAPEVKPEPVQPRPVPQQPAKMYCPGCGQPNAADSVFCSSCGQRISGRPDPMPAPAPAAQPAAGAAQVRYADESMKKWTLLPGEKVERGSQEIVLLQPDGGKFAYYMEVTNKRILLTREGSGAKNVALVARMGGGLVGSLIAEGVKAASGTGPKPWLEIPLTAVTDCGLQNKKEFYIAADQRYVLKNKGYEKYLPDLIANAKRGGN